MKDSPLKVEGYFFTHVDVRANIDFDIEKLEPLDLETNIDFLRNTEEPDLWQVTLTVDLDGEKNLLSPYTGKIEAVGVFRHAPVEDDDEDESKLRTIIGASAPAVLYSAAREMYLVVAGRGPWPAAIWPAVHFRDTIPTRPEDKSAGKRTSKRKAK